MSDSRKEVAIAGCGVEANEHLKILTRMKKVHLAAVCDLDEQTARKTANQWNIRHFYTDFSQMLKDENVSIVSILTPPQVHASMAIEAIMSGMNVLVEKPFAITTGEARSVLDALKVNPVKLTLDYNALLSHAMMKALDLIRKSEVGQVLGGMVRMLHTQDDPMASNANHWCHRLPGGRFGELLAHPVYLLQSFLVNNMNIEKIFPDKRGTYNWMRYDELYAMLHGENGTGQIYVSFNAPRPAYLVDIYGTKKILALDLMNQTLLAAGTRTLSKTSSAIDSLNTGRELFTQTVQNAGRYFFQQRGYGPLTRAYASLIDSIDGKKQLVVTPEMAFYTVKIVEDIVSSL